MDPDCAVCHSNLGERILGGPAGTSRVAEAEELFRRATALCPDLRQVHFNLGTALMIEGRYSEAEAPLRRYLERAPKDGTGPQRLGHLYVLQKRYEEAIPLLRTARIQGQDMPYVRDDLADALQGRARELQAKGSAAEAEPLLAESRRLQQGAPLSDPPRAGRR